VQNLIKEMILLVIKTIESTKAFPYISRANIIKQFDMSKASADKRIREIREEIEKGRYSEKSLIKDGGFVFVSYLVFIDYLSNRQKLMEPNLRKYVEPFNAYNTAREIGWYN
jgi:hypothetical protein